jgi:hypothetical protein
MMIPLSDQNCSCGAETYSQEDPDPNLFATEVRNCAGSSLTLEIWSAKVL